MELSRKFDRVHFSAEVLMDAGSALFDGDEGNHIYSEFRVSTPTGTWRHESESEFYADYRQFDSSADLSRVFDKRALIVERTPDSTRVRIRAESREPIQRAFAVFSRHLEASRLPEPPEPTPEPPAPPRIFIGHGRNQQWKDLRDHLQDKHYFKVQAYEIGARAGHSIRDILHDMLARSTFAVLVMTGEDELASGEMGIRANVIHEAGLFQGRLGFNRAIMLIEDGAKTFSNIQGIEQIRFSKDNIKETFGEVVATIHREFGSSLAK